MYAAANSYHFAWRKAYKPPPKAITAKIVANSLRTGLPSMGSIK
jgi:hypothetical protein